MTLVSEATQWRITRVACAVLLSLLLLVSQSVRAEPSGDPDQSATSQGSPSTVERARALFQTGLERARRGDYAAAAAQFSEALKLHDAPAVEYNLASALYEGRSYVKAYHHVQRVLSHPQTTPDVRAHAEQLARALQAHVSCLTVHASGEVEGLVVSVDGRTLKPAALGRCYPVLHGDHEVVATRGEETLHRRPVHVPRRIPTVVDMSFIALNQAPSACPTSEEPTTVDLDSTAETRRKQRLRRWVGVAGGVLALGVGVAVGALAAGGP